MTFKQLRKLLEIGPLAIEWQKSGIVEVASIASNGAVIITNVITRKKYTIPKRYNDLNIKVLNWSETIIPLGKLLPKKR